MGVQRTLLKFLGPLGPLPAYRLVRRTAHLAVHLLGRPRWLDRVGGRVKIVVGEEHRQALQVASEHLTTVLFHRAIVACCTAWIGEAEQSVSLIGEEHLEKALSAGRGAVLVSGHFGQPVMGVLLLVRRGYTVMLGAKRHWHEPLKAVCGVIGLGWTTAEKVGALQKLRHHLRANGVVLILVDSTERARSLRRPFLGRMTIPVAMGPFVLGSLASSPILPFFVLPPQGSGAFEVRVHPPLQWAQDNPYREETNEAAMRDFLALYESYVRCYPGSFRSWERLDVVPQSHIPPSS
jgi:lauroyl/myristoyl acyltransferase